MRRNFLYFGRSLPELVSWCDTGWNASSAQRMMYDEAKRALPDNCPLTTAPLIRKIFLRHDL